MYSEQKSKYVVFAALTLLALSCQVDAPNTNNSQKKENSPLTPALRAKVKSKGRDIQFLKITPFAKLQTEVKTRQKHFEAQKIPQNKKDFQLKQFTEVACYPGTICSNTPVGDWDTYYAWENYYAQIYNDPKYRNSITNYLYPSSTNENGDQLCAYESRNYCANGDADCLTEVNEITMFGCICPQQYNQSPPNFVSNPTECAQYDHLLPGQQDTCAIYWQKINSCYQAGGNPSGNPSQCKYHGCDGVQEQAAEFCQTYEVNGQSKQSCTTCPDGQDMFFSDGGIPVACRPVEETSHTKFMFLPSSGGGDFSVKMQTPYAQGTNILNIDNSACRVLP